MLKRVYLTGFIIFLCSVIFVGCPSPYLETASVYSSLDKTNYDNGEDIKLVIQGNYRAEEKVSCINIRIDLSKKIGDEEYTNFDYDLVSINGIEKSSFINNDELIDFVQINSSVFDYTRYQNYLTNFSEKIIFRINEPGDYILRIFTYLGSDIHTEGGRTFEKKFLIVE